MLKNTAQKIHVFAYDYTTGAPKTGDAANITAYISIDGTANAVDDANPAEVDATNMPGVYAFDITAVESNCDSFALYAKSTTANVRLDPIIGYTSTVPAAIAGAAGGLVICGSNAATTFATLTSTGAFTAGSNAIPWNAAWDTEVESECTDALNAYDPPTNTEMAAAFTEIKGATWAATDTLEAIRDRGDAAWITATGFAVAGDQMDLVNAPNATAAAALATALLDLASAIDGKTLREATRIIAGMVAGKVSGAGTGTEVFKGLDGTTTRATVTVDASGNRLAVSY